MKTRVYLKYFVHDITFYCNHAWLSWLMTFFTIDCEFTVCGKIQNILFGLEKLFSITFITVSFCSIVVSCKPIRMWMVRRCDSLLFICWFVKLHIHFIYKFTPLVVNLDFKTAIARNDIVSKLGHCWRWLVFDSLIFRTCWKMVKKIYLVAMVINYWHWTKIEVFH